MPEVRHLYLVLGDQLNHSSIIWDNFDPGMDMVWMAEVSRESAQVTSSNQRTILFLSAMRHFAAELKKKSISVCYFKLSDKHENFESALDAVQKKFRIDSFKCVLPGDYRVYGELEKYFKKKKLQIEWLEDNHFITRPGEFREWMQSRKQPRMEHWYRYLRKDRDILMDNNKPEGGKWNYDKENRKAFGKAGPGKLPGCIKFKADTVTKSVIQDVKKFLPGLYGNIEDFQWPVTRKDAQSIIVSRGGTRREIARLYDETTEKRLSGTARLGAHRNEPLRRSDHRRPERSRTRGTAAVDHRTVRLLDGGPRDRSGSRLLPQGCVPASGRLLPDRLRHLEFVFRPLWRHDESATIKAPVLQPDGRLHG